MITIIVLVLALVQLTALWLAAEYCFRRERKRSDEWRESAERAIAVAQKACDQRDEQKEFSAARCEELHAEIDRLTAELEKYRQGKDSHAPVSTG